MLSFLNIIDLCGILPFFLSLLLQQLSSQYSLEYIAKAAQIFRILRILRIFKLSRHITGLKTLGTTLRNSHRYLDKIDSFFKIEKTTLTTVKNIWFTQKYLESYCCWAWRWAWACWSSLGWATPWRRTSLTRCSTPCPRRCTGRSSPWPAPATGTSRPRPLPANWLPLCAPFVVSSALHCQYLSLWQTSTGKLMAIQSCLKVPRRWYLQSW